MSIDIQTFMNALSDAAHRERSNYHLTLGGLIKTLADANPDAIVVFSDADNTSPCEPHSYRGYYSDLAFERHPEPVTAAAFHAVAKAAFGQTFVGYKGGDFVMEDKTPLWVSPYGHNSGDAIIGASVSDTRVLLLVKHVD